MGTSQLILEIIKATIWPAIIICLAIVFKGSIPKIVSRLKGAELPGTRLEFFEEKEREIEQLTEAATTRTSDEEGSDIEITDTSPGDDERAIENPKGSHVLRDYRMMGRTHEVQGPHGEGWVVAHEVGAAFKGGAFNVPIA